MTILSILDASQRLRGSSHVRNLLQKWDLTRCECDHALATPTGPAGERRIAKGQRCSSTHRDLLQLSTNKKTDPLAIGGEERFGPRSSPGGCFRSGDRAG